MDELVRKYVIDRFSADSFCDEIERMKLEQKYQSRLEILDDINRKSVSFQLSKNDRVHSWLKYKEGFSASLVEFLIEKMNIKNGDIILDPFFGSGTTGLVAQMKGISSVGFDILPTSKVAIEAKENIFNYNINELDEIIGVLKELTVPFDYMGNVNSFAITEGAYPEKSDKQLAYLSQWLNSNGFSLKINNLVKLCIINCLEDLSFTRKDGQYLRWDYRSKKVIQANESRKKRGIDPLKTVLDKGQLPDVIERITAELENIKSDINYVQKNFEKHNTKISFHQESVLKALPIIEDNYFSGVITSPPYCNRYDYTRTYALELAYLGLTEEELKELRQTLLSCTVENKSKEELLKEYYAAIGKSVQFEYINSVILNNRCYQEVINALNRRNSNKELNNNGIIPMVTGYFYELAFIYAELYRTCKNGSKVYFVNDNVRYGGEVIPVDFLSCDLAESFGFHVDKVYCIKQQKGNSSQQMKKYGRVALRKSITEWTVVK